MRRWFVRQQSKVFGPFDESRLRVLVDAKQFEQGAECGESWNGPWRPLANVLATMQSSLSAGDSSLPAAGQHVPPPPVPIDRRDQSKTPCSLASDGPTAPTLSVVNEFQIATEVSREEMPGINGGPRVRKVTPRDRRTSNASHLLAVGSLFMVAAAAAAAALLVAGSPELQNSIFGRQKLAKSGGKRPASSSRKLDVGSRAPADRTGSSGPTARTSRLQASDSSQRAAPPLKAMSEPASGPLNQTEITRPPFEVPAQPVEDSDEAKKKQALAHKSEAAQLAAFALPAYDPDRIDVIEVRRLSESLRAQPLGKEDSEIVNEALSRIRPRDWKDKKGKKVRGEVTLIMTRRVHFRNDDGEGPFPRDELADSSETHLKRIADSARDIYELNRRLMSPTDAAENK